jgi:DNA end-binding protein Ku
MVYADEVIGDKEIGEFDGLSDIKVSAKELAMAKQLVDSLTTDFDPDQFRDDYRDKVLDLIERKAAGEEVTIEAPEPADEGKVVDLMAALEASVKSARAARTRHPGASEDTAADEDAEPAKKPAKKTTKRAKKSA